MYYIIDIREEHEIYEERIISKNTSPESSVSPTSPASVIIFYIPMKFIKWNVESINYLSKTNKVYILCRSSNRSDKVKQTYFPENENIESIKGGINALKTTDVTSPSHSNNTFQLDIEVVKEKRNILQTYGIQQYMQMLFAILLSITLIMIVFNIPKLYISIWISAIILFIIYQIVTKSCLLSTVLNRFITNI